MGKVVAGMTMSLDGFVADAKGDLGALYPDLEALRKTEMLKESIRDTGAVVMGRRAYDLAQGDLTGYEYQTPIYVVTHRPPKAPPKGQNERLRVHFVPEGVEAAVRQAKAAADGKDVTIIGGAQTIRLALAAHLVDELQVGIVPVFLGTGLRFFEGVDQLKIRADLGRVLESPGRVDLFYRISK
jgi:dihydrofolate reductase